MEIPPMSDHVLYRLPDQDATICTQCGARVDGFTLDQKKISREPRFIQQEMGICTPPVPPVDVAVEPAPETEPQPPEAA